MDELGDYPGFSMILDDVRMLLCLILPLDSLGDERDLRELLAAFLRWFSAVSEE